jgi:hypothetical protein
MAASKDWIRAEWIRRLESGKYQQTKGCLYNGEGYCCLGVLCEIAHENGIVERSDKPNGDGHYAYCYDEDGIEIVADVDLPHAVMAWAGINTVAGTYEYGSLVSLNDDKEWDFKHIAEIIRIGPKGLFNDESNQ